MYHISQDIVAKVAKYMRLADISVRVSTRIIYSCPRPIMNRHKVVKLNRSSPLSSININ
jgi:hypothetical protein